jgi:hypothetical protein
LAWGDYAAVVRDASLLTTAAFYPNFDAMKQSELCGPEKNRSKRFMRRITRPALGVIFTPQGEIITQTDHPNAVRKNRRRAGGAVFTDSSAAA